MKTKTVSLKSFAESFTVPALARAVVRQSGGWENFQSIASDVASHGADSGFGGWTYYSDTTDFYKTNRDAIKELAQDMADSLGESGAPALVKGFNCLRDSATDEEIGQTLYGSPRGHDTTVANALAWFALEEVARHFVDHAE